MDLPSREKWYEYSRARDRMMEATDYEARPLGISCGRTRSDGQLNIIIHFLSPFPTKRCPKEIKLPKRSKKHEYDDQATLKGRKFIPEAY